MDLIHLFSSGIIGYVIIFFLNILNSIILPIPEEAIIITCSYLANIHAINRFFVLIVLFLGVLAGDNVAYWLGRSYGPQFLIKKMKEKPFFRRKIEKAEALIKLHGGKTIFLSRFLYGFRFYTPIVAGTTKMYYPKFFLFNFIGAVIWVPSLYILSYIFINHLAFILRSLGIIKEISYLLLGLVIAIIAVLMIRSTYRALINGKKS